MICYPFYCENSRGDFLIEKKGSVKLYQKSQRRHTTIYTTIVPKNEAFCLSGFKQCIV
jgi:hypothetical protein